VAAQAAILNGLRRRSRAVVNKDGKTATVALQPVAITLTFEEMARLAEDDLLAGRRERARVRIDQIAKRVGDDATREARLAALRELADYPSLGKELASLDGIRFTEDELIRIKHQMVNEGAENYWPLAKKYYEGTASEPADDHMAAAFLLLAAEAGEARAAFLLGRFFLKGRILNRNVAQGITWLGRAADAGSVEAVFELGNHHRQNQQSDQAFEYYLAAAQQGLAAAQTRLGHCYETGSGTAASPETAAQWYRLAADQGDVEAIEALQRLK
jgi:TPR repeat protein